jgi:hypothetical protein
MHCIPAAIVKANELNGNKTYVSAQTLLCNACRKKCSVISNVNEELNLYNFCFQVQTEK